jgi:SAM-dependent methyltransferase
MVAAIQERLVGTLRRNNRIHRAARRMRFAVGRFMPPRRFPGMPGRIHFNDFMFLNSSPQEIASYAERARNVIALIDEALAVAGKTVEDINRWLDFGCGYGRVIRFLVERVPRERIFASDVVNQGVDFCRTEFGVKPVYSAPDLSAVELGLFDFIYAISVITHLNERNSLAFLKLLGDSLNPGGIAMFTTHGEWSIENIGEYGVEYEARRAEIANAVRERGFAYLPYSFVDEDYGMTWHSREYIERQMAELNRGKMAPLLFKPHGLDGHQDVFAFRRVASPGESRMA